MKRWNTIYEHSKLPIKILCFAFVLIAFGYLIQNSNVNIFYTIRNPYIKLLAEMSSRIGHFLVTNMPLIFMVNLVSKRANSGVPILLGLVGYVTYLVTTMMLAPHTMSPQAYSSILGISYNTATSNMTNYGIIYPLQTGMIGSFLVAFITRFSYIKSRKRSIYSFLGFLDKDTAAFIYNIVLCILLGFTISLVWPYLFNILKDIIVWIAEDISDPLRLGVYGFLDRSLSILGLGNIIRQPFWFGASGGTYSNIVGETILGDVNIWRYMPSAAITYSGAGRFITPYYVINMFIVPAIYLGIFFTYTDKAEKKKHLLFLIGAIIISVLCGNPLPIELLLLFNAPLLLIFHLFLSSSLFAILPLNKAFLGFEYTGSTISAMPGSFPDYIINARTAQYIHSLLIILIVGIIMAIIYFIITMVYYRYLAYDVIGSNRSTKLAQTLIDAMGGVNNITSTQSSPFKLTVLLEDLEEVSYDKLKRIGYTKIIETKEGLIFELGSSSTIIKKRIDKIIKESTR